jgi:hypothetical protein
MFKKCDITGHLARDCKRTARVNVIQVSNGFSSPVISKSAKLLQARVGSVVGSGQELIVIPGFVNNAMRITVDSGATASFMAQSTAKRFKFSIESSNKLVKLMIQFRPLKV